MANLKLGEFINSLALKAGLQADNAELKAFLADPACQAEIDSKISDVINSGLMNEAAALNNEKIADMLVSKGRSEAYDAVDAKFRPLIDLLDDADKAQFQQMKFATEKIAAFENVFKTIKDSKKADPAKGNNEALQKQVDDLILQLKAEKDGRAKFEQETNLKYENDSIDNSLKSSLFGRNWLLPTTTDSEIQFALDVASQKVKSDLTAKGYKLVRENGILTLKTNDGLKVYDANHTEVELPKFIDAAISGMLAPTPKPNAGNPPAGGGGNGGNNRQSQNMDSAKASLAATLEGFN